MHKAKRILTYLFILLSTFSFAQQQKHIALFTSLYLDSAFANDYTYKYGNGFPKHSISGLEFYLGAQFALDSLSNSTDMNVKVHVFDLKSQSGNIQRVAKRPVMDSIELIIGAVSGSEYLALAKLAQERNIPFVSATYPNDGGVKNNPFVLIANPKLNTHLVATYNYILKQFATFNMVYVRRKNVADNRLSETFTELNKGANGAAVLKYKTAMISDSPLPDEITALLDSTKENLIIAGSLDENFGRNLSLSIADVSKRSYAITVVGMPTWESIKEIQRSDFKNIPIIYSNSFFNKKDMWSSSFEDQYRTKTYSRPSDIAYKGYELTWFFSQLLNKYGRDLINHVNEKSFILHTDFDFTPIRWNKNNPLPDYYENKKVYMVRRYLGQNTVVN